ncbi:hypothetical protein [Alkaliphilus hydrothermalis]|uniref:Uncharacterized protein n=1 Tax=Alkaliphilus hydrothermalis TaxID=1482730 RepID=A0ABS2NLI1_9FIRM|nr:hypothetical protein [Alkaliphilus hydrothermalis]MBM7613789.1 hypothetical protein [Alkaliphilus hydrothermalis]
MATIVKHIESGHRYILLGTGYGAFQSDNFRFFSEREGQIEAAAVCDNQGTIKWFNTCDLQVVEIDGQPIGEIEGIDTLILE